MALRKSVARPCCSSLGSENDYGRGQIQGFASRPRKAEILEWIEPARVVVRHSRLTRARVVSRWRGLQRTTTTMLPPCSRSESTTALQAAHRPRLGTLENRYSPLIHQMKCYTKSLKSHTEKV
jgi:hypothetical protein